MDEFLRQNYFILTHLVEFLAAAAGLIFFKKHRSSAAKYFIYFLVAIFLCEVLGRYTSFVENGQYFHFLKNTVFEKNYWWTTVFWSVGSVTFFSYFYYKVLESRIYKLISLGISILFFLFSLTYIGLHWHDFFVKFFLPIIIFGAIVVVTNISLYFIEMLQNDLVLLFYKSLYFYVSCGLLIWWLITTPVIFYDFYFSTADWNFVFLKWQIFLFANIFMYSTFAFALIYCKTGKKVNKQLI